MGKRGRKSTKVRMAARYTSRPQHDAIAVLVVRRTMCTLTYTQIQSCHLIYSTVNTEGSKLPSAKHMNGSHHISHLFSPSYYHTGRHNIRHRDTHRTANSERERAHVSGALYTEKHCLKHATRRFYSQQILYFSLQNTAGVPRRPLGSPRPPQLAVRGGLTCDCAGL